MFSKKGQSISINVIIIAVIALLVLIILIAVFTGNITPWDDDVKNMTKQTCSGNGGTVVAATQSCQNLGLVRSLFAYDDVKPGQQCCIPPLGN